MKTDSKSNMEKFLELNRMITEAENHKCWKTALTSAGEAMRKYWNAAFKVSDMLKEYCEKYECVDPLIEYDLRIVFRKGVHAEGPMRSVHETIEEALCNAGVSFSDFPENIEFDFDHVNFTRKDNQFFICGFDPDNDVYHNMSYELYLTPDEVLKAEGVYDKHRLFGVTVLDVLRSETFLSEELGVSTARTVVPVIGGHSGTTILPLISQVINADVISDERIAELTTRIQNAGTEVVEAKVGAGSATLSMATAGARFALKVVRGLMGEPGVTEYGYTEGDGKYTKFFAQRLRFGTEGWDKTYDIGKISAFEQKCLDELKDVLNGNIKKGVDFATEWVQANK